MLHPDRRRCASPHITESLPHGVRAVAAEGYVKQDTKTRSAGRKHKVVARHMFMLPTVRGEKATQAQQHHVKDNPSVMSHPRTRLFIAAGTRELVQLGGPTFLSAATSAGLRSQPGCPRRHDGRCLWRGYQCQEDFREGTFVVRRHQISCWRCFQSAHKERH